MSLYSMKKYWCDVPDRTVQQTWGRTRKSMRGAALTLFLVWTAMNQPHWYFQFPHIPQQTMLFLIFGSQRIFCFLNFRGSGIGGWRFSTYRTQTRNSQELLPGLGLQLKAFKLVQLCEELLLGMDVWDFHHTEISGFPVFLRSDSSMGRSNAVVSCGEGQEGQPQLSLFVLPLKLKQKLLVHWVTGGWRNDENIHWVRAFDADCGVMLYKYNEHAPFLSSETKQHCRFLCQLFAGPDNVKDVGKDKKEYDRWSPHFKSCL